MYGPGRTSSRNIVYLTHDMQLVVMTAYKITEVDFSVVETIRTLVKQKENMEADPPVSWTMDSDHIPNENGEVLAADIYPWVNGKTSHDREHYKLVAKAMFHAASIHNVQIKWGGFWLGEREDQPHWAKRRERKHAG